MAQQNTNRQLTVWLTHTQVPCWHFSEADRTRLQEQLPEYHVVVCADCASFLEQLPGTNIAVAWTFDQEWFARAPNLELLATPAAGRDYFSVTPPDGVRLHYGSFHGELMAETVLAMILGVFRGVLDTARLTQHDPWPRERLAAVMQPLRGTHMVILGFGSIGTWVGRLAKPFGVRISGVKRTTGHAPDYFDDNDRIVLADELDSLLPDADVLVACLPGNTGTDHILDRSRLARLPRRAVIVNIGRGNAIDEQALAAALHERRIRAACLDVFPREPLPDDSPLRSCPNVLLMPHAAAIAPNYMALFIDEFVRCMRDAAPGASAEETP